MKYIIVCFSNDIIAHTLLYILLSDRCISDGLAIRSENKRRNYVKSKNHNIYHVSYNNSHIIITAIKITIITYSCTGLFENKYRSLVQ